MEEKDLNKESHSGFFSGN